MAASSSPSPPQTFPLFSSPQFPRELQDLIFHHAITSYPSRVLELTAYTPSTVSTAENDVVHTTYSFTCWAPVPPLLHAYSRSRELASRRWNLSFASKMSAVRGAGSSLLPASLAEWRWESDEVAGKDEIGELEQSFERVPRVWIDFDTDVLLVLEDYSELPVPVVGLRDFFYAIRREERERVRNLVVPGGKILEMHEFFEPADSEDEDEDEDVMGARIVAGLRRVFPGLTKLMLALGGDDYGPRDTPKISPADSRNCQLEDVITMNAISAAYNDELGDGVVKVEGVFLMTPSL